MVIQEFFGVAVAGVGVSAADGDVLVDTEDAFDALDRPRLKLSEIHLPTKTGCYRTPKKKQKHQDPTDHGLWYPDVFGPWN